MKKLLLIVSLAFFAIPELHAQVEGYGPWKFGMSSEEVPTAKEFGPYKPVEETGGLETFNAKWRDKKTNIYFIFKDDGLDKIQIWAYEGGDRDLAVEAWWEVASYLREKHGAIEFRKFPELPNDVEKEEFVEFFSSLLEKGEPTKVQMGLVEMPEGAIVFSSLFLHPEHGFYVFLFYRKNE